MNNNRHRKKKEILDEIQDITPKLLKLKKANPYVLPSNYFDQLEEGLRNELKSNSPYKVSDDYFKDLSKCIEEKIRPSKTIIRSKTKIYKLVAGIAASTLLVAAIYFLNMFTQSTDHSFSSIDLETELFLEEHIEDLELEELLDFEPTEADELFIDLLTEEEMEFYIEENINDFNIEELTDLL